MTERSPDCIIIGGGVMGCAIALRFAQAGLRTVVVERSSPGAEASSAAAGILAAQEEAEGPGPLVDLAIASRELFGGLAAELREDTDLDIGYRRSGVLRGCFSGEDERAAEHRYAWQRERGWRLDWLRGDALREVEPALSPKLRAGLWFADDAQLDARVYVRALSLAAARRGVEFVTGTYVRSITHDGTRATGIVAEGLTRSAGVVVVAGGAWSSLVDSAALPAASVRPVRGQIAALETRPAIVRGTIVSPRGGYVIGRPDGRVLAGSTMEHVGYDKAVTAAGLRHVLDVAIDLVPALAEAPVTDTWANFRPGTPDGLPVLGAGPLDGLLLATGHFRSGILLSAITAEIVRDLVVSGASKFDLVPFSYARLW